MNRDPVFWLQVRNVLQQSGVTSEVVAVALKPSLYHAAVLLGYVHGQFPYKVLTALVITPSHQQNTHVLVDGRKNMNDIFDN